MAIGADLRSKQQDEHGLELGESKRSTEPTGLRLGR